MTMAIMSRLPRQAGPGGSVALHRRTLLALSGAALTVPLPAMADRGWNGIDMTGASPPLRMALTRARDGKAVTEADYRGDIVLLTFGYTSCPDVCPLTLSNLTQVLSGLGKQADRVRVLFVTVDPDRDTLAVLKSYVGAFAPQIEGMRATPDALTALARRYRIAYSVTPESPGHPYEVTHSAAVYVFDGTGAARLLIPSMGSQTPDIAGTTADLRRLIAGGRDGGIVSRVMGYLEGLV